MRGPQGTQGGRVSTAGQINLNTKDPTFTEEGSLLFGLGENNLYESALMISGPINEYLAARFTAEILNQDGEFLIKTGRTGDKPVNGFSKAKAQLDRLSGVQDWKFHDIRRTVATNLSKLGVDRFLLQRIVNHTDSGVTDERESSRVRESDA